jgi:2-C-methyl-D-erythritol 4-phosphate cytidylyltransferase
MPDVGVIIAGGGQGTRIGGKTPKQFLPLAGLPVLARTVGLFNGIRDVSSIVVVVPGAFVGRAKRLLRRAGPGKVVAVIPGGRNRQESVWEGLQAFKSRPDIILVHDAVRPFVRPATVAQVIKAVRGFGAAVVGVRVTDTIKVGNAVGYYVTTLDRSTLWAVQTPQGFRSDLLFSAHRAARRNRFVGTDEASLVERLGVMVRIVEGDYGNIKITTREDLRVAKMMAK